jgi:hypothetical protein
MADSPAKRRKTSPTTSVPINASNTPSRIPIPSRDTTRNTPSSRPSFASPTKASLSRHNPQLLNRPSSSGSRDLQDVFAQALAQNRGKSNDDSQIGPRDGSESVATTQENDPPTEILIAESQAGSRKERAVTPKARSKDTFKHGLSGKPRRISRSPSKVPEGLAFENLSALAAMDLRGDINPFQKKGLRRSPPPVSQPSRATQVEPYIESTVDDPFKKTGLRRSPVASQVVERVEPSAQKEEVHPEIRRGALRRSPIGTKISTNTTESVELTNAQDQAQEDTQLAIEALEEDYVEQALQSQVQIEVNSRLPEQHGRDIVPETQAEAGSKDSTTPTGSVLHRSTPTKAPTPTQDMLSYAPDLVERPAQSAATTLLRNSLHQQRTLSSTSPQATKSPVRSVVEEIMNPFMSRSYREPELPPTPTQRGILDPVVTTPPSGIHDTPSKRSRKRKPLSEMHKSSPLKPKDQRPEEPFHAKHQEPLKEHQSPKPHVPKEEPRRRRSSRFLIAVDPHAVKKRERDKLLSELQQLRADVALGNQENERMRVYVESKKSQAPNSNPDELLAMLLRSTDALESSTTPAPEPVTILKSINSFLPFRPRRKPAALPNVKESLPSHLPIPLDDPLPYLQVFSPLMYSSSITLLPQKPIDSDASVSNDGVDQSVLQRHIINASHPSGLFVSRLAIITDSSLLAIKSIDILRLDMRAELELGSFMRARAEATGAMGKDIIVIFWAMSRWVEVSIQRARFWCAVEDRFGTLDARRSTMLKNKKRKHHALENHDHDEKDEGKWTRRQLLANFGRRSMDLVGSDVQLRFEWKISFDYTGEAESLLAADVRIPESCKSLTIHPRAYNSLLIQP